MQIIHFDMSVALGDTINEKFESLYTAMVEVHRQIDTEFVISSPETLSVFESPAAGFRESPTVAKIGNLCYGGFFNNYSMPFNIYHSANSPKDEIVMFGKKGNATIKITNFLV